MSRPGPLGLLAVGSLVVLAGLAVVLFRPGRSPAVVVFCAAALRPAMEATAAGFTRDTGRAVEFRFGNSETMLAQAGRPGDGDLFAPADDSYVRLAEERGLVASTRPLARMRAVVLAAPGNPYHVRTLDDLTGGSLRVAQATPDGAAVGKVTRDHLRATGRWDALAGRTTVYVGTVTDAANAVQVGAVDAAVVWDAVAFQYPKLATVRLPELDGAVGRVAVAVLKGGPSGADAERFADYAAGPGGKAAFGANGFGEWGDGSP